MEEHFIELINQHQKIIHKVCRVYAYSQEAHSDLFQEILLQLWKSWSNFRNQSKISTWMYKVALNTAMTYAKKEIKMKGKQQELAEETMFQARPDVYEESDFEKLQDAISKLSRPEKAIILLYLEKHSYKEIALMIGITETNVGAKINRIKTKLKSIMNG